MDPNWVHSKDDALPYIGLELFIKNHAISPFRIDLLMKNFRILIARYLFAFETKKIPKYVFIYNYLPKILDIPILGIIHTATKFDLIIPIMALPIKNNISKKYLPKHLTLSLGKGEIFKPINSVNDLVHTTVQPRKYRPFLKRDDLFTRQKNLSNITNMNV